MQLQNETIKERTPIKGLLIDWLIIFGTYLFIRVFFALFGLHQNIVILGCCLAVLPYLLGAVYLQKSHKQCPLWLSAKLAHTHYWDRDLIGTDTEEISGSDKTDLYALLRWKF